MNTRGPNQIVYIHPTAPYHKIGNTFVEYNPTLYMTGLVEFYFETARCLMDLTYTQTLMNFTNINVCPSLCYVRTCLLLFLSYSTSLLMSEALSLPFLIA